MAGKKANITITNDKGRLSKDDIERMVREAEQFADEDKAAAERIQAKNGLESYCYSMKNTMGEEKTKAALGEDDVKAVTDKVDEVMQWLDNAEKEEFESMQKDLESVANPIMQKLYAAGGAPDGAAGGMPGAPDAGAGDGPTIEE